MALRAELHDGTVLEFPDETDPGIVQATVKRHLSGGAADAQPAAPIPAPAPAPEQGGFGGFLSDLVTGAQRTGGSLLAGINQGDARAFHAVGNLADMVARVGPIPGAAEVRDWARLHEGNATAQATAAMPAQPGIMDKVNAGIGAAPEMFAEILPAARVAGPIAGMGGVSALQAADQGPLAALEAGAKGALLGATQEVTAPLTTPARVVANVGVGGLAAAGEGGNASDIAAGAITQGAFGALPTGGNVTARDLVTGRNRAPVAEPIAIPAPPEPPPKLVVARKMPDGTVQYGKPGDMHPSLFRDGEDYGVGETGFALPGGPFMSREEAIKFARANEPERETGPNDTLRAHTYFSNDEQDAATHERLGFPVEPKPALTPEQIAVMAHADPYQPPEPSPQAAAVLKANAVEPPPLAPGRAAPAIDAELAHEATVAKVEDTLAARAASRPEQPLETKADLAAREAAAAEQAAAQRKAVAEAPAELTNEQLAEARDRGEQPPAAAPADKPIAVGEPVRTGGEAPAATTARAGETDAGTEAGIARARGEGIASRIGEDPGVLVHQQFGVPTDQFHAMPTDAKERLVAAAQRQRGAEKPTDATLRVTDTSGDGPTSPPSAPQRGAGEAGRGVQPTDTELARTGDARGATATGTGDRPFKAESTDGTTPEQQAGFEQRARDTAADARKVSQEDLERQWQERATSRQSSGERPFGEAEQQYAGGANFSTKAAAPDGEGRYGTDKWGFVASDKGGPVRFADQKQAARWIINQGHAKSPDQIFEVENHPSGKGFTVRERGRSEAQPDQQGGGGNAVVVRGPGARTQDGGASPAEARAPGAQEGAAVGRDEGAVRGREEPVNDANHARDEGQDVGDRTDAGGAIRDGDAAKAGRADKAVDAGTAAAESAGGAKRADEPARTAEAAREDAPVTEAEAHKTATEAADKGGPTFYSNPLDPGLIKDVFSPIIRGIGRWAGHEWQSWQNEMHQFKDALKSSSALHPARAVADGIKALWYSNDGVMRSVAARFREADGKPNAAITEIANKFFAPPGRADTAGTGRTYGEAVEIHHEQQRNRLAKILEPMKTGDRDSQKAKLDQLGKMLRADSMKAGRSQMDDIAVKIRDMLREELKYMKDAGVEVGEVRNGYLPRELDTSKVFGDPTGFIKAAEALYRAEGASPKEATAMAEAWFNRLREGDTGFHVDSNDFMTQGQAGTGTKFEKSRTLSKRADEMLSDWYIQNPAELLPHYFLRAARRSEWTRVMGKDMENWTAWKQRMSDSGVDKAGLEQVVDAIRSATGTLGSPATGGKAALLGLARNWSAFTYLTRATYSSLAEPILAGIRTGNTMDALNAYGLTVRDLVGQARRGMGGEGGKSLARDLAEDLGLISRVADQMLMAQRFGTDVPGQLTRSWADRFFAKTGLTQWTDATRVASTRIGQVFLRRLATDIVEGSARQKSATFLLGELGIKADQAASFARWVKDNGDGIPGIDAIGSKGTHAETYKTALNRFLNQVILRPKAVEKPKWATHPLGSLFYGLQSYNYSFQKNVLARIGNTAATAMNPKSDLGALDRLRLMTPMMMLPILVGTQYGLNELRDIVWPDPGKAEPKTPKTDTDRLLAAMSRANMFGTLDMPANMIKGMRYQREPATVMLGPLIGGASEMFGAAVGLTGDRNSPTTDTAERRAAKLAYNVFVQPAIVGALSLLPGNSGTLLGGLGIQFAASPYAREKGFVEPVAGAQSKLAGGRSGGLPTSARDAGRSSGRSAGR